MDDTSDVLQCFRVVAGAEGGDLDSLQLGLGGIREDGAQGGFTSRSNDSLDGAALFEKLVDDMATDVASSTSNLRRNQQ